ncbi:MAG: PhoH family protein [Alphaproteobacteria bacterium]|nr:PhoH family protein [Alphaproteobacteria bacterium]
MDENGDGLILTFDDNRLLPHLFGEHDQHLALIEDRLGVSVMPRGNHVAILGQSDAQENARQILSNLYERLSEGFEVQPADVDGAIRLHVVPEVKTSAAAPVRDEFKAPKDVQIKTRRKVIHPRSRQQGAYISSLQKRELVFGIGPAGTGKTYLAVACAAAALMAGEVDRIILSRPAVEAGERLGFLPGDMKEKVDPYLRPLYDALYDTMPANQVTRGMEDETIEIAPLAFMRGRTLARAFVILDEAQNCTPQQMKMFLTRLGEGSRMVVTGDPTQVDLPRGTTSGLAEAVGLLGDIDAIDVIRFTAEDIVRHPLVTKIVNAYEAATAKRDSAD